MIVIVVVWGRKFVLVVCCVFVWLWRVVVVRVRRDGVVGVRNGDDGNANIGSF